MASPLLSGTHILLFLVFIFALPRVQAQEAISNAERDRLSRLLTDSEVFAEGHTGFSLYDLESGTELSAYNADRLFVPASNVKLLTFYVANRILGNMAPAVFYQRSAERYEVWGTGYPLTLHPEFLTEDMVTPWLRQTELPVTINFPPAETDLPRYGSGWSWDDYNGGYVFERSTFPMFGNRLFIQNQEIAKTGRNRIFSSPPNFINQLQLNPGQRRRINREESGNNFTVRPNYLSRSGSPLQRSVRLSPFWMVNELNAAVPGLDATLERKDYPPPEALRTYEVTLPDTVYRRFLQNSDNYLAEQLLLTAAAKRYGRPDEEAIIDYAVDTLFPPLGIENLRWADGSGLSRYSLVTPRHLTTLLIALEKEVGRKRMTNLLPEGGTNGTLERRFDGAREPYVWAKTGTLSGVTCLSGYVRTKTGRWLAFSFLHNNFVQSSRNYYAEMEKILGWCFENL